MVWFRKYRILWYKYWWTTWYPAQSTFAKSWKMDLYERSGWTVHLILQHQLVISKITPREGSSYFSFSKELANPLKGLIDIQNEDNALDGA